MLSINTTTPFAAVANLQNVSIPGATPVTRALWPLLLQNLNRLMHGPTKPGLSMAARTNIQSDGRSQG